MRKSVVALLLAMSSALSLAAPKAEKLYFYTENFPPYNMSATGRAFEHNETEITGLCAEMVKAILAEAKVPAGIKLRNWSYSYDRALRKKNHGVFCAARTEAREKLFKWVGPLAENRWTLFAPPGSTLKLNTLEEARNLTIASYKGSVRAKYLEERGYKLSLLDSDDLNPKRLALGQVDLWIAERLAGPYLAAQNDVEGLVPVLSFNRTELYLAINPQTSDALVQKLQSALQRIQDNGVYDSIKNKYGL